MKKGVYFIWVLITWLIVSCQQGSDGQDGETGPTGSQGPTGESGVSGQTGQDGIDGIDGQVGACWDSIQPQIEKITYNSSMYVGGGPYTITINFNGSLHSVEDLEFELRAMYGTVNQSSFPNHNQFSFTPVQSGGPLTFTAFVSDTCQKDFLTFTIDFIYPAGDLDGNFYHTVTIGTQVWMVENLKVTHYNNGSAIPNITDIVSWNGSTTGAYCNYDNNGTYFDTYGRLYNWYAVNTGILCPTGWHVPTDEEWITLATYLGTYNGGRMKTTGTIEAGTGLWHTPNTGATNESGFSVLPAGYRDQHGAFSGIGWVGGWWSATEEDGLSAWNFDITYLIDYLKYGTGPKYIGSSVRCVKD